VAIRASGACAILPPLAISPDDCPRCGRGGMVGTEREIVGVKAVTVFKCHNCNYTWRVADEPAKTRP
jgi:transposase-like protein